MGQIQNHKSPHTYTPCAIYYEESDSLEYVRNDIPSVYRRVDDLLTLILAMDDRRVIGFKLKGFRHFYLRHFRNYMSERREFLELVQIVEQALGSVGDRIFDDQKRIAYQRAIDIAQSDKVEVRDLPKVMHG